jgi:hypothetical protein
LSQHSSVASQNNNPVYPLDLVTRYASYIQVRHGLASLAQSLILGSAHHQPKAGPVQVADSGRRCDWNQAGRPVITGMHDSQAEHQREHSWWLPAFGTRTVVTEESPTRACNATGWAFPPRQHSQPPHESCIHVLRSSAGRKCRMLQHVSKRSMWSSVNLFINKDATTM